MSIFDRINAQADAAKERTRAAQDGWWKDRDLWKGQGTAQSITEFAAIDRILAQCHGVYLPDNLVATQQIETDYAERESIDRSTVRLLPPIRFDPVKWCDRHQEWVFDLDAFIADINQMVSAWVDTWMAAPAEKERAIHALALREQGETYPEIAKRLGYRDKSGAEKAVSRLTRRIEDHALSTVP